MLIFARDCVLLVKEDTKKLKKTFPQVERSAAGSADAGSGIFCATPVETITWYGQFRCTPEQNLGQPYCSDRIELADATYYGDWTDAISILEHASKTYGQSWANCLRIGQYIFFVQGRSCGPFTNSVPLRKRQSALASLNLI